ncbi:MAG: DNA mismatch repair protein MutS, partial [Fluviicola sp.]
NAVLQQEGFVRIVRASDLVNHIIVFFDKRSQDYPKLIEILSPVFFTRELIELIEKVFDRRGQIRDDASPELFAIRQAIAKVRTQINKNFDKEMRKYLREGLLGETKEAYVNERRVLTVVSSFKRKISGSVVGSSKT